jgi:hypothetical protein
MNKESQKILCELLAISTERYAKQFMTTCQQIGVTKKGAFKTLHEVKQAWRKKLLLAIEEERHQNNMQKIHNLFKT